MQLFADLFTDLLELGAVIVAMTGILGQLMDNLDARQFGRQDHPTATAATLDRLTGLSRRVHLVDEEVTLRDTAFLGGGAELTFDGQAELLEQRRLGGFPLGSFFSIS